MKAQRTVERQNGTLAIGKQPVASSRAWRPAVMTTNQVPVWRPPLITSSQASRIEISWVSLRSVGRAVEETSLAERAVTSQEPENQVTTVPCASAGAGAETQSEPPGSPQELSDAADEVATIERPDNQGGDYSPTVISRRRLPSDPPPVPLDDTSV